MPGNDADDTDSPAKFVPGSTAELVTEAERQLGAAVSIGREHLRRTRLTLWELEDKPMRAGDTRGLRDVAGMMMDLVKWQHPKGKPDDMDRPLEETMRNLLEMPAARDWAVKILKEYEE